MNFHPLLLCRQLFVASACLVALLQAPVALAQLEVTPNYRDVDIRVIIDAAGEIPFTNVPWPERCGYNGLSFSTPASALNPRRGGIAARLARYQPTTGLYSFSASRSSSASASASRRLRSSAICSAATPPGKRTVLRKG